MNQPTPPHVIDPARPFGSVTAGPQQFTFIADFDHSNVELMKSVRDNVKAMAQSGVKHVMLELTEDPRSRVLLNYINKMPSIVSDKTIMAEAPSFALSNVPPEDRKRSGEYIAGVLIEAKNNGMKVHFVNDDRGFQEGDVVDALIKKQKKFMADNPKDDAMFQEWMKDPDYINKQTKDIGQRQKIFERLDQYGNKLAEHYQAIEKAEAVREQARMGPQAEEARADKIFKLANGERAVVMFGAGHALGSMDINEMLDRRIKEADPSRAQPKTVVMGLHGSRADFAKYSEYEESRKAAGEHRVEPSVQYYVREKEIELTASGSQMMAMKGAAPQLQAVQGISFGSLEQMAGTLAASRGQSPVAKPDEPDISRTSTSLPQSKPKAVEFGM